MTNADTESDAQSWPALRPRKSRQVRLSDDQREWLMEAFHAWDHPAVADADCARCVEFVYDFEPLILELARELP